MRNLDLFFSSRRFNECILSVAGTCTQEKEKRIHFGYVFLVIFASLWSDVVVVVDVFLSPSWEKHKTIITRSTEKMSVVSRTAHLVHMCNALHGRVTINDTFSTADDDVCVCVFFFHFFSFVLFCSLYNVSVEKKERRCKREKSETH